MISLKKWLAVTGVSVLLLTSTPALAAEKLSGEAAEKVPGLLHILEETEEATRKGDYQEALKEIKEFYEHYEGIETQVKAVAASEHEEIEEHVDEIKAMLAAGSVNAEDVEKHIEAIAGELKELTGQEGEPLKGEDQAEIQKEMQEKLAEALEAAENHDWEKANTELGEFYLNYEAIEAQVKANQTELHEQIEDTLDEAKKMLATASPDQNEVKEKIEQLQQLVNQVAVKGEKDQEGNLGGIIDSATILLREGFEALLVFAALLAFLRKAGQQDRVKYLYAGALSGVAASFLVAWIFGAAFTANVANREIAEGVISLIAAAMLFYVSYWLISKANAEQWQQYIAGQTKASLEQNNVLSLAFVAFLAVFREGFETVLFYAALIPQIGWASAGTGMIIAALGLLVVAIAIFVFGMKVPIRPFFTITGALLYYLAFKFAGAGVHELQEGKLVGETIVSWLPKLDAVGFYPTVETAAVQGLLLAAAILGLFLVLKNKPANS